MINQINIFKIGDPIILKKSLGLDLEGKTASIENIYYSGNSGYRYQILLDSKYNEPSVRSHHYTISPEDFDPLNEEL